MNRFGHTHGHIHPILPDNLQSVHVPTVDDDVGVYSRTGDYRKGIAVLGRSNGYCTYQENLLESYANEALLMAWDVWMEGGL